MVASTYIQLTGRANNTKPEVETNSKALRVNFRPTDYYGQQGGHYAIAVTAVAGATPNGGVMWALRWMSKFSICRVKSIYLGEGSTSQPAGFFTAHLYRIPSFQHPYVFSDGSSGTNMSAIQIIPSMRSTMNKWAAQDLSYADNNGTAVTGFALGDLSYVNGGGAPPALTTALSGNVVDSFPLSTFVSSGRSAVSGTEIFRRPVPLWESKMGDYPISLTHMTGLHITISAGQLLSIGITVNMEEIPTAAISGPGV